MNADQGAIHSLVMFRLGGEFFALSVDAVREVVPIAALAKPVQMPAAVEGILNLGGVGVPVLRLDRLLGLPECSYGLEASILVNRDDHAPIGLLVEHVEGVHSASAYQTLPVPPERSLNGCVAATLQRDGMVAYLLATGRILLEEERRRIAEFSERARARLAEVADGVL